MAAARLVPDEAGSAWRWLAEPKGAVAGDPRVSAQAAAEVPTALVSPVWEQSESAAEAGLTATDAGEPAEALPERRVAEGRRAKPMQPEA